MNDERMQPLLDAWFHSREVAPRNVPEGIAKVMANVPRTRQQGRWLPFALCRRKAWAAAAIEAAQHQSDPVLATNGHAPIAIGRTRLMFSPAKVIVAAALVFAIGGAFLIGQPLGQQAENVPAAEAGDYAAPVKFTAVMASLTDEAIPACEAIRGMMQCLGAVTSGHITAASDPRLAGTLMANMNQNQWALQPFLDAVTLRIANDDGAWQGSFLGVRETGDLFPATVVLTGEGAYEGLYAWMDISDMPAVSGVIFGAPPPQVPELPASAGS